MRPNLKLLVIWGGRFLLLVALVFVGLKLHSHWSGISNWRPDGRSISILVGLAIFYGSTLFLLAESWHWIVNIFGRELRSRTYTSFTTTQVAKYIPGNIAHLVGRGLYLRGSNLSDPQIVKATLIELSIIPAGALICIVLLGCIGQLDPLAPQISPPLWRLGALLTLAAILTAIAVAVRLGLEIVRFLPGLLISVFLAAIFMGSLGVTFAAVFHILGSAPVVLLAGASILAWLIGFLTPGAPGGVGIREAMLITLLGGLDQEDSVLIAAALFRLITTFGDVFLLASGWLIFREVRPSGAR